MVTPFFFRLATSHRVNCRVRLLRSACGGAEAEDTAAGDHEGQAANDRDLTRCGLTRTLHLGKGGSAMAKKAAKKTAKKAAKKR
jgi:hypothetical protein